MISEENNQSSSKFIIQPTYEVVDIDLMYHRVKNLPKGTKPRPKKSRRLKNALKVHNKFNVRKYKSRLTRKYLLETIRETVFKLYEESERGAKECQHG